MRFRAWIVIIALAIAWQNRVAIHNWISPPAPIVLPAGVHVAMYGTEWCGYCAQARQFFADRKISYREFDIEKSSEANTQYEQLGGNGIPLIVINNEVIHGFDEDAIVAALQKL